MSRQQALDTLDLDGDASVDGVKATCRERVKETHPDSETDDEKALRRVDRAYKYLAG